MMMKSDYLPYIDLPFRQPGNAYHFNTDTVLLGLFLPKLKNKIVLDIGTNCGALLCYAACKEAKMLYGVDLNVSALEYAETNIKELNVPYQLYSQDFREFPVSEIDAIIVNPPFYPDKERKTEGEELALNESNMPLDELFRKSRSILKDNGSIYMIYPADHLNRLLKHAMQNDFSVSLLRPVYDANKNSAIRTLVQLRRGIKDETRVGYPILIKDGKILKDKGAYLDGKEQF
ncbi:MAG: methyltransferase [Erysipelotrichaceae bacterium]|nr:methyltransferase [Erysipelotrichaceae bacterium]